jgi:glycerol-3-phosphate dehydrogenase (NAD(P)+)
MQIVVLGAGSWGTAFAVHLERLGHGVTLVPRRIEAALDMATHRENRLYLPNVRLGYNLQIMGHLLPALMEADLCVVATPIKGLMDAIDLLIKALPQAGALKGFLVLSKGLNLTTLEHPFECLAKAVSPSLPVGVLSGPNHALSVAQGLPAAAVLGHALEATDWAKNLQQALSGEAFRIYTCADRTGVSLGGALKNMYAIGAGMCEGLNLGDNAKAAFLTRAVKEMTHLGVYFGGLRDTFFGLSGLGDLMATAYGPWSRNHQFGLKIGQGASSAVLLSDGGPVVEGYTAVKAFHQKLGLAMDAFPILSQLWAVLYEGCAVDKAVMDLMKRPLADEGI